MTRECGLGINKEFWDKQRMGAERAKSVREAMDSDPENKKCVDCGSARPQWASLTYGTFLCLDCAGVHRSFGVKVSTVRSVGMDKWAGADILRMQLGGNKRMKDFFKGRGMDSLDAKEKYHSAKAAEYAAGLVKRVNAEMPGAIEADSPKVRSRPKPKGPAAERPAPRGPEVPYINTYTPASGYAQMPSTLESLQTNVSDVLSKVGGLLYSGASFIGSKASSLTGQISERIISPASETIKERTGQLSVYVKGRGAADAPHTNANTKPARKPAARESEYKRSDEWSKWD